MKILVLLNQLNILRFDKYLGLAIDARDKHRIAYRFFIPPDFNQNWNMGVNCKKSIHYEI
jgi:hypothetical protein